MIKFSFCLRRLPHLSREAFQKYWFETHGPLVTRHSEVLRIRRYVQVHTGSDALNAGIRASRGAPEPYDGIAELWWDGWEMLSEAQTPAQAAASRELLEDERKFIDHARSPLFFGEEKVFVG